MPSNPNPNSYRASAEGRGLRCVIVSRTQPIGRLGEVMATQWMCPDQFDFRKPQIYFAHHGRGTLQDCMAERRFPIQGDVDYATSVDLRAKLSAFIAATDDDIVLDCEGL